MLAGHLLRVAFVAALAAASAHSQDVVDPGLISAFKDATSCSETVELRSINALGSLSDSRRVFHLRTVITDMLAPRGNNYIAVVSGEAPVDWVHSCSMNPDDVVVAGDRIYVQGKSDDQSTHLLVNKSGYTIIADDRK